MPPLAANTAQRCRPPTPLVPVSEIAAKRVGVGKLMLELEKWSAARERCPASVVHRSGAECVYGACFQLAAALLPTAPMVELCPPVD